MSASRVDDELLTTHELACWLKTDRFQVYRLIHHGLPSLKLGVQFRFKRDEVLAWMRRCADGRNDGRPVLNSTPLKPSRRHQTHTQSLDDTLAALKALAPQKGLD